MNYVIRVFDDDGTYYDDEDIYSSYDEAEEWGERIMCDGNWEVVQIEA